MNAVYNYWFWLAIIAIILIIIAYSLTETVGASFGNNPSTPWWVWLVWGIGLILLTVAFIWCCVYQSNAYRAKKLAEACNPTPKEEKIIACPVPKSCGCVNKCGCSAKAKLVSVPMDFPAPAVPMINTERMAAQLPGSMPVGYPDGAGGFYYSQPRETVNIDVNAAGPVPMNMTGGPFYTTYPQGTFTAA
jgi:hypothetical protein